MKKTILQLVLSLLCVYSFGQNPEEAEKLVKEGVELHDKGNYQDAIAIYDKALKSDSDNVFALGEKAFSLLSLKKYDESILLCQRAIEKHPDDKVLKTVYTTYALSLKRMGNTGKALEIYDEGMKKFPDYYQLYYNKGVTLVGLKEEEEAISYFQKSVLLNPAHASTHNAIANTLYNKNKRIPALLAYCRFLILEPTSQRASENLASLQNIMKGNVEVKGKKNITINISSDMLGDTTKEGKPNENSFATTDLILAMDAALDYNKENKKNSDIEQFIRKFETVCASLEETKKDNFGFYWDFYVPYFIELKNNKWIETFAYIAFASSDDKDVAKWIKSHKSNIEKFYEWSESYKWKSL